MALADSSILITPGSGATVATRTVSGKQHEVVMVSDYDGHIQGSGPTYILGQTPRVTTAAATDLFDVFNATGSGKIVRIRGLYLVVEITAASAIIPSFKFSVIRTSAIGSGGTGSVFEGAASPATGQLGISRISTADASTLPAQITARALPTAGATAAAWLFDVWAMTEETNAAPYLMQGINMIPELPYDQAFELQENQGIKVRQITPTASTGTNFGWIMTFVVIP